MSDMSREIHQKNPHVFLLK